MALNLESYLIILPLVFLAGFIDSIAGGGGLISLPAYYLIGLPPDMAAGTNKMSAFFGTAVATGRYAANRSIPWKEGLWALLGSVPYSFLGAELMKRMDARVIKLSVLIALPIVAAFVLLNKDALKPRDLVGEKRRLPACFAIGALIGLYDGLVGPGTGTFLQLLFVSVIGMEALMGSGAARLVNLGSNVAALLNLALSGHVLYALAIPAAAFGMAGNYLGSTLAITRGSRVIRGILILVLTLLMGKLLMDVLGIRF